MGRLEEWRRRREHQVRDRGWVSHQERRVRDRAGCHRIGTRVLGMDIPVVLTMDLRVVRLVGMEDRPARRTDLVRMGCHLSRMGIILGQEVRLPIPRSREGLGRRRRRDRSARSTTTSHRTTAHPHSRRCQDSTTAPAVPPRRARTLRLSMHHNLGRSFLPHSSAHIRPHIRPGQLARLTSSKLPLLTRPATKRVHYLTVR